MGQHLSVAERVADAEGQERILVAGRVTHQRPAGTHGPADEVRHFGFPVVAFLEPAPAHAGCKLGNELERAQEAAFYVGANGQPLGGWETDEQGKQAIAGGMPNEVPARPPADFQAGGVDPLQ